MWRRKATELRGLELRVYSFARISLERAVKVGEAFDRHPDLRPRRVGGDPARIRVEDSLTDLIRGHGLPIEWLMTRENNDLPDFEGGELKLWGEPWQLSGVVGDLKVLRAEHEVAASFNGQTMSVAGRVDQLLDLFSDLAQTLDATYGYLCSPLDWEQHMRWIGPHQLPNRPITVALPDIFWTQYFGPAFVRRWPALADVTGANLLKSGGVLVRTTTDPGTGPELGEGRFDAAWKQPLLEVLGVDPFTEPYGFVRDGRALPSEEDHVLLLPPEPARPSVAELEQEQRVSRERQLYPKTRARRLQLEASRETPVGSPDGGALEWSRSIDLADFSDFWTAFCKYLQGEFRGALGRVLGREIGFAPVEHEEATTLASRFGPVTVHWFIDDLDVVDFAISGPPTVYTFCESVLET